MSFSNAQLSKTELGLAELEAEQRREASRRTVFTTDDNEVPLSAIPSRERRALVEMRERARRAAEARAAESPRGGIIGLSPGTDDDDDDDGYYSAPESFAMAEARGRERAIEAVSNLPLAARGPLIEALAARTTPVAATGAGITTTTTTRKKRTPYLSADLLTTIKEATGSKARPAAYTSAGLPRRSAKARNRRIREWQKTSWADLKIKTCDFPTVPPAAAAGGFTNVVWAGYCCVPHKDKSAPVRGHDKVFVLLMDPDTENLAYMRGPRCGPTFAIKPLFQNMQTGTLFSGYENANIFLETLRRGTKTQSGYIFDGKVLQDFLLYLRDQGYTVGGQ